MGQITEMILMMSISRRSVLLICLLVLSSHAFAQKNKKIIQTDIIEIITKKVPLPEGAPPQKGKKVAFTIIPATTQSGGKQILVSSINAAFIIGHEEKTNFSSVFFLPYTDFSENFGFGLKYNLFTPRNVWNIPGEFRVSTLTQYSFGLGGGTTQSDQFRLTFDNIRFNASANYNLYDHIFGGMGLAYDRNFSVGVSEIPSLPGEFEKYGIGTKTSYSATGITFNLLHDNRKNSINPSDGLFVLGMLRVNPSWLSNEDLWTSFFLDWRRYYRLDDPKRKIIAVSAYYWGSYGKVPYFNLPGTQLDINGRSGRGYPLARFRGRHMFYAEGEYRFDISRNGLFGGVGFLNIQIMSEPLTNKFEYINPAVGFGARVKFNKKSDTNLAIDFGFAPGAFNFYIGLGEWF